MKYNIAVTSGAHGWCWMCNQRNIPWHETKDWYAKSRLEYDDEIIQFPSLVSCRILLMKCKHKYLKHKYQYRITNVEVPV